MKITLPNSAMLQNIESFLDKFDPSDDKRLELQLHDRWVAVHPAVLALTACIGDHVTTVGGEHVGSVPSIPSLPYLIRMCLFEFVKVAPPSGIHPHDASGRFIPLSRICDTKELSDFIVNMIPLLHADPVDVEPIRYVVSELVRNVLEHAAASRGAFVCAQYYRESRRLSLGVADAGIGIRKSMAVHRPTSDWNAVRLALRPGVSGTTARIGGNEYNAGAGLFFTKSIACASRNYFIIYSGRCLFKLRKSPSGEQILLQPDPDNDYKTVRQDMPEWPGTLLGIDIGVNQGSMFTHLMKLIRNAYSLEVKQAKKEKYRKPVFK